jgi:diguanylate cyclase (GGDEF)-like protein/PAS domain S-box-containing protein
VYVNSGVTTLLGWSMQQVDTFGPKLMDKLLHPEDQLQVPGFALGRPEGPNVVVVSEYRLLHADGTYRWFSARETVYSSDDDGNPREILGSAVDITARKKQERDMVQALEETRKRNEMLEEGERRLRAEREYLAHAAYTDGLTGLENHRALRHRLEVEFQVHRASGASLCVVMMDLDRFKDLNDKFGHPAGDEALKQVGELLKQAVRSEDCAARYGGEEFAIVCPATSLWQGKVLAERLRKALERLTYREFRLTASFGVAVLDDKIRDPDELLELADRFLYEAKRQGKNRVCSATGTVLFESAVE